MGRGKEDPLPIRMDPGAGRFPHPRRNPLDVSQFQIHQVNLVKGIPFLALALKYHLGSIGGEIPLPGAAPFKRELTGALQEKFFISLRRLFGIRCGKEQ